MAKALSVITTGEVFRIATNSMFVHGSMKPGTRVECYNALLKETRWGKRHYDKLVTFVFDPTSHKIVDTNNDKLIDNEKRRARELVCQRFHRGRCSQPPYELHKAPVSVARDQKFWEAETIRVSGLCLEYLKSPHKFDRTRLSVLTMDVENLHGWLKRAQREEGIPDGDRRQESGVGGGGVPKPA